MPSRCYVPYCKSGYPKQSKIATFSAPKNADLLQKWKEAIPRIDKDLSSKDRVCEKHFDSDQIIKEWKCDCPKYLLSALKKRRITHERTSEKQKLSLPLQPEPAQIATDVTEELNIKRENSIFDTLWNNVPRLPSCMWSKIQIYGTKKCISFVKYYLNHLDIPTAERQVLIHEDLTITYIFVGRIVEDSDFPKFVNSNIEIENLLLQADVQKFCNGGPSVTKYPEKLFKYNKIKTVDHFSNVWRHKDCNFLLKEERKSYCNKCKTIFKISRKTQYKKSQIQPNTSTTRLTDKYKMEKIRRLTKRVNLLQEQMKIMKHKMTLIEKSTLIEEI